jgi:hypothetical protein
MKHELAGPSPARGRNPVDHPLSLASCRLGLDNTAEPGGCLSLLPPISQHLLAKPVLRPGWAVSGPSGAASGSCGTRPAAVGTPAVPGIGGAPPSDRSAAAELRRPGPAPRSRGRLRRAALPLAGSLALGLALTPAAGASIRGSQLPSPPRRGLPHRAGHRRTGDVLFSISRLDKRLAQAGPPRQGQHAAGSSNGRLLIGRLWIRCQRHRGLRKFE